MAATWERTEAWSRPNNSTKVLSQSSRACPQTAAPFMSPFGFLINGEWQPTQYLYQAGMPND